MICDGNTCPEKCINEKTYEYSVYDADEDNFIRNLKHEKCKIIQLVRRQMHKFHDTQFKLSPMSGGWQKIQKCPSYSICVTGNTNENTNITPRTLLLGSSMPIGQAWCLRILRKIRKRICVIVLIAGIIALVASIYGIYFRVYLCTGGKSCITSFRYTHTKYALF